LELDDRPPTLILCDWAEVLNGKLYMMGAGWTRILANSGMPVAIAVLWFIPWGQANQKHNIEITLWTEDGQPVKNDEGQQIGIKGQAEVGRPPGLKHGSWLESPIALKLPLSVPPGGYRFELRINDSLEATASFEAVGGSL
jgi:hypothetical protein